MAHCNECRSKVVVVLVVMLTGYLPENASRAFNMLIWLICIIEFSSEFPVKLPKWICLTAYFLAQLGDGYWEIL